LSKGVLNVLNTIAGADCVSDFRKKYDGKVLVGCGTVMGVEDAQRALEAGAEFIVCPILIPEACARPQSSPAFSSSC
jgi:2-keto-3-deoxy-6-phosphogluconate aldolase